MTFLPAYAIDGGRVPAQMLRLVAWATSSGATGIVQPGDLRVRATSTPSNQVVIDPGGGLIETRYGISSAQQSYAIANESAEGDAVVEVPATGSAGGATRYVGVRIDDPQYAGQVPEDPENALYNTPVLVSSIEDLTYPFLPLARIAQPASTATITQAMITDIREMALPRRQRDLRTVSMTQEGEETLTSTTGEWWPNAGGVHTVDIPAWATRLRWTCTWGMAIFGPGNIAGNVWMEFGPYEAASTRKYATQKFRFNSPGVSGSTRMSPIGAGDQKVPADVRGTSQTFVMKGQITSGPNEARPILDWGSAIVMDLEFLEAPAEDV